jgi:hypothetical protein
MPRRCSLLLIIVTLLTTSSLAQATRNRLPAKSRGSQKKSAVGIIYSSEGGSHITDWVLKTPNGTVRFQTWSGGPPYPSKRGTPFIGFRRTKRDSALGEEWRVVYHDCSSEDDPGLNCADSVTFTGRVEPSIVSAENLVNRFSAAYSERNYNGAYSMLSPSAKQKISPGEFRNIPNQYIPGPPISICSHSNDRVIVLMKFGVYGGPYQRSEIVRIDNRWYINELFPLTSDESSRKCWDQ